MPEMDGYELLEKVRSLDQDIAQPPVIALTAAAREKDRVWTQPHPLRGNIAHVGKKHAQLSEPQLAIIEFWPVARLDKPNERNPVSWENGHTMTRSLRRRDRRSRELRTLNPAEQNKD
jgi:CheY-like chemotaxis protein